MHKRLVTFICDVEGWAYKSISDKIITELKGKYDFQIVYKDIPPNNTDIVICHNPNFLRFCQDKSRTILKLDGFRAFEQ